VKQPCYILLLICIVGQTCLGQGEWVWAKRTFKGGGNEGISTSTDKEGNVFVAGILIQEMITGSIDLNPGFYNDRDIFVIKYDSSGNTLWGKNFGGRGRDLLHVLKTDVDGGALITGYFESDTIRFDNIILTNTSLSSYMSFFIAKLDLNGNVVWAKKGIGNIRDLGVNEGDYGGLATDIDSNIYVVGTFGDGSLTLDDITIKHDSTVSSDGCYNPFSSFIAKYNSGGNILWAKTLIGSNLPPSLAISSRGEIYLHGTSTCSGRAIGNITLQNVGEFLAKLDTEGNALWVKDLAAEPFSWEHGFHINSQAGGIAIDPLDNIYIVGEFANILRIDSITLYSSLDSILGLSLFAAKFDTTGHALWAKIITRGDAKGIAVNASGDLFITGYYFFPFNSIDPLIYFGNINLTNSKKNDDDRNAFVAQCDNEGTVIWANLVDSRSGSNDATTFSDDVYVTGTLIFSPHELIDRPIYFGDIEIPAQQFNQHVYFESMEMFIAKLNPCERSIPNINKISLCPGERLTLNSDPLPNYVWSTGEISPSIIVNSAGTYRLSSLDAKGCLKNIETTIVTLRVLTIIKVNETESICPGESITLTSASLTNNTWSTGEISPSITVKSPGIYSLSIFNSNDCTINIKTTTVSVYAFPKATIKVASLSFCEGESEELESNEAVTYQWNTGEISKSINVSNPGSYHVTITDSNGCSTTSDDIELKYTGPLPDILLQSGCDKLFLESEFPIQWFRNNEQLMMMAPDQKEYIPLDSGFYHIEISNLCDTKKSNVIHFIPSDPHFLTLPNVITPNGDAYNEFFVLDEKLSGSALVVINRWGIEVYSSEHYGNNWSGGDLSSGTYFYVISNSCFAEKLKGVISVIR